MTTAKSTPNPKKPETEESPESAPKESSAKEPIAKESPASLAVRDKKATTVLGRPIGVSTINVVETVNVAGLRPIGANTFEISEIVSMMGMRPIGVSSLMKAPTISASGIRPIAPNENAEIDVLIGYLD